MIRIATVALALGLAACGSSNPATHFRATLNAANEPGGVTSSGTGAAEYTVDGGTVSYTVTFTGLTANANAGHIHVGPAGVNGGVRSRASRFTATELAALPPTLTITP